MLDAVVHVYAHTEPEGTLDYEGDEDNEKHLKVRNPRHC